MRAGLAAGLVLAAVAAAGCGRPNTEAAADGPVVTVIGLDTMRFTPETIELKAGESVTLKFKNGGFIAHDLITQGADKNANLANVGAGQERLGTFLATKPGTYSVICVQPGHREAGMVGKVVVQ